MATTLRDEISAKNRADVEAQTAPDQMWQSMSNQYDQQAKQIQQGYDRAYSQADNQLLSRGMGRSSYGGQVLANISKQGIDAQTQNHNDLIAAYQNWLANYNTQQEQFQWQKDSADRQIALSFLNNIAANGGNPSDDLLAKAGISRADFNSMKYVAPATGGGGGSGRSGGGSSSYRPKATTTDNPGDGQSAFDMANTGSGSNIDIMGAVRNGLNSLGGAVNNGVNSIGNALNSAVNAARNAVNTSGQTQKSLQKQDNKKARIDTGLVK